MEMTLRKRFASAGADALVAWWLGVWWLCNLLQAGLTELANDEAYYHMFAEKLAWGYFDHPPVTALLVRLGGMLCGGELGVRLFFTLLQPLYLYIFWRLIRPAEASRRDGVLYVVITAAMLMMQLYGFIAVPDGPLMFTAALFLWAFRRFSEGRRLAWLWMGLAMAAMAYSKYHGALLVIFCLAANPRLLLRPGLYLGGATAALLLVPHLLWQYDHDWASFAYHLVNRNARFVPGYPVEFLLNVLVVFNPFYVPLFVKAWRCVQPQNPLQRALKLLPVAFIGFFLLSSLRGYVQPQWVIVASFGLIWLLFDHARRHPRTRRYVMRAGGVTILLMALVRLEAAFNPLGLRFEVFDNEASYGEIARIAGERPVVFRDRYAVAAKYRFYTGREAYCQPNIRYRTHQWQYRDDDLRFAGRPVVIETAPPAEGDSTSAVQSVRLANGRRFSWIEEPCFRPVRQVDIGVEGIPGRVVPGQELHMVLRLTNPYDYAIRVGEGPLRLAMFWKHGRFRVEEYPLGNVFTIPARGEVSVPVTWRVPDELAGTDFQTGFALVRDGYTNWFNGKPLPVEVAGL